MKMTAGAIVLALLTTTGAAATSTVAAAATNVALISASAAKPPTGDRAVADALTADGYTVTIVDDDDLDGLHPLDHDLIAISGSVAPYKVGDALTDQPVPVIVWEHQLYDDLGLTGGGGKGTTPNTSTLAIAEPAHPIASGLTGEVEVTTAGRRMNWGVPSDAATIVAVEATSPSRPVVFAYDTGAAMRAGVAPARRVGLHLAANSPQVSSADGDTIFDNAVSWALGASATPVNRAPDVDAGPATLTVDDVAVELTGSVVDDGLPTNSVTIEWTTPDDVTIDSPDDPTTSLTLPGPGSYILTLTADDGELASTDSIAVTLPDPDGPPTDGAEVLWITAGRSPTFGEQPGVDELHDAGMNVHVVADDVAAPADATGMDLIVITSSVNPSKIDAGFADLDVPIIVWEPFVFDSLGLVSAPSDRGQSKAAKQANVVDSSHPLAAGLAGTVDVLSAKKPLSWGDPPAGADVIATTVVGPTFPVIFAYDTGAETAAGPAPTRRLGFFLSYSGPRHLTDDGWALWDAAIEWALGAQRPDGEPPTARFTPISTAGEAPLDVDFDASASSDPDGDIATYTWDFGDGTTGSGVAVEHSYSAAGIYSVTLTVTDATGRSDTTSGVVTARAGWAHPDVHFRVRLDVAAIDHRRVDAPIVTTFDATAMFEDLGATDATFDPDSLRVVETDSAGNVVDEAVVFQFDRNSDFDPTTSATGDLVVLIDGSTPAGQARHYDVYFDTAGQSHTAVSPPSSVVATVGVTDEGRDAIRVATPVGTWWYDEDGGGFSSLDDIDGNDWISFNSAAGAAGQFRGIPNAVHPAGFFHPGNDGATSRLVASGPARVTIESTSSDGGYVTQWHIYPTFAEMHVVRAGGDFWFLYEGTPGGALDATADRVMRPDGTDIPASGSFTDDLDDEEWVLIADRSADRSIFLAHLEDDDVVDSYHALDGEMTVFGFGRGGNAVPRLDELPATFRVGLVESAQFATASSIVRSVASAHPTSIGAIEQLHPGDLPPVATAAATPTSGDPPLAVSFHGSASTDDGTVVSYAWDFGDGSAGALGATTTHTYTDAGTHVATLTVTDDTGHTDTDTVVVAVGTPVLDRVTDGLLALYEFKGSTSDSVVDTSGVGTPLDLVIAEPAHVTRLTGGGLSIESATTITSPGPATKISEAVVAAGEFTVEAWVRTADISQNGPARIASVSSSATDRNMMIGQGNFATSGERIEARFRTDETDTNGRPALISPIGSFDTSLSHVVYTRRADGRAELYIDGSLVASRTVPGDVAAWDPTMSLTMANEFDGSRPWLGELHLVAFYDHALSRDELCNNLGAGPGTTPDAANLAPTACLIVGGSSFEAPATVTFDASTSRDLDGAIVSYRWNFGDGVSTTTTAPVTRHRFDQPGEYLVTLTTVDDVGATGTASAKVVVTPPTGGNRVRFSRLASPDPRLPAPAIDDGGSGDEQQTASLVADLDGDGDNDIVIAGRKPPGAGIVWFEFVDANTGWIPHVLESDVLRVEAGGDAHDIDADGDIDVVFGRDGTGSEIWWWENPSDDGDPTAEWQRHLIKDGGDDKHHDLQFGDVDGDGDDELVFWNQRPGNRLVVAEIPAQPAAATWPTTEVFSKGDVDAEGLTIADVDLDGTDDIVGAGMWFERRPDGSFEPNVIDADYSFSRTAVGQLVPGGRPEVVIDSGDSIGPLNWYEWDPATDSWTRHELLATSTYGHSLRLGDVDADGHLDIFSAEMVSPFDTATLENPGAATRILFGDGLGGFELQLVATGADHHESRLADVDADGDLDIVGKRYNIDVPGIDVWLNEGVDPFGRWSRTALDDPAPWTPLFVFDADVDADGDNDILTGGWWYERPDGGGSWTRHEIGDPLANVVAVDDLDGDGDPDVIGSHWKIRSGGPTGAFSWGRNDGDGTFTVFPIGDTGDGPFLQGAALAQLEPGGPTELVLSWNTGAAGTNTIVVPADLATTPNQAPWTMRSLSPVSGGEQIVPSDLDDDGDTDLVVGNRWLRNDPGDSWTPVEMFTLGTGVPDRIVLADIDGDGDDDAVIGNGHDPNGELSWYERPSDPAGMWEQHLIANLVNPQSVDVADLDGDGDADIVVGEHNLDDYESSRLLIYENTADGEGWAVHPVHTGDEHHDGAHLTDLDHDGDLDIVSIGFLQQRVVVYENLYS